MSPYSCDLCDNLLNGWCLNIPNLGIFCEKCVTETLTMALGTKYLKAEEDGE